MSWNLRCGLCGADAAEIQEVQPGTGRSDLVLLQEHAMEDHGLTQENIIAARREPLPLGGYRWRLSDGRIYLVAISVVPTK